MITEDLEDLTDRSLPAGSGWQAPVEDEPDLSAMLVALFTEEGYHVELVTDGRAGPASRADAPL